MRETQLTVIHVVDRRVDHASSDVSFGQIVDGGELISVVF